MTIVDDSLSVFTADIYNGILRDVSTLSLKHSSASAPVSAPRAAEGRDTRIAAKKLTIVPPSPFEYAAQAYSAHRFVDGRTLREPAVVLHEASSHSVPTIEALSARALVRPVSTPPTPVAETMKVIQVQIVVSDTFMRLAN